MQGNLNFFEFKIKFIENKSILVEKNKIYKQKLIYKLLLKLTLGAFILLQK